MKFSRFFTVFSIGVIGFCLTSAKSEVSLDASQKTCYVYKNKKKQAESKSNLEEVKED
jgi:hypothetical protein